MKTWEEIRTERKMGNIFDTSTIKKDAKEVIFNMVSCMCDNKNRLRFKKNSDGEFRVDLGGHALTNLQMKYDHIDLTWEADEGKWDNVGRMIETGTSLIGSIISR